MEPLPRQLREKVDSYLVKKISFLFCDFETVPVIFKCEGATMNLTQRISALLFVLLPLLFIQAEAQLRVLSPDGGERFTSGDIVPVIWSGIPLTVPVNIGFSTDNGATWTEVERDVTGGRYLWTVPDIESSDQCLVRVQTQEPNEVEPKFIRAYEGHEGGANSVDISPDNVHLVTAGADGVVVMWNMGTGQELWRKKGHSKPIILTRFSPDGTLIATGSIDGTAIIWNAADGSQKHVLEGKGGMIWPVGFSPDRSTLATGNDDGTITLWNVQSGESRTTFDAHKEAVRYLEYTPDGSKILASSTDKEGSIIDAVTKQRIRGFVHTQGNVAGTKVIANGIQLTHDETVAITCGYDGWVRFWDAQNGRMLAEQSYHNGKEVSEIRISPNGRWMTSVGYDGTTKILDPHTGTILADIDPDMTGMIRSSFSPDNRYVAISHFDGKATLWEIGLQETDISDGTWTAELCDGELTGIEERKDSGFSDSELDLKARP